VAWVDRRSVSPERLGFLEQSSPWPGGHWYYMAARSVDGAKLKKDLRNLGGPATPEDSRLVLHAMEWLVAELGYKTTGYDFFVNTVDEIASDDHAILIGGVCSPVMKSNGG
jgi:hypothetical protein